MAPQFLVAVDWVEYEDEAVNEGQQGADGLTSQKVTAQMASSLEPKHGYGGWVPACACAHSRLSVRTRAHACMHLPHVLVRARTCAHACCTRTRTPTRTRTRTHMNVGGHRGVILHRQSFVNNHHPFHSSTTQQPVSLDFLSSSWILSWSPDTKTRQKWMARMC